MLLTYVVSKSLGRCPFSAALLCGHFNAPVPGFSSLLVKCYTSIQSMCQALGTPTHFKEKSTHFSSDNEHDIHMSASRTILQLLYQIERHY